MQINVWKEKQKQNPQAPHGHQSSQAHTLLSYPHHIGSLLKRSFNSNSPESLLWGNCMVLLQPQCTRSLLINEIHVTSLAMDCMVLLQPRHTWLFPFWNPKWSVVSSSTGQQQPLGSILDFGENFFIFLSSFFSSIYFFSLLFVIFWSWLARLLAWAKRESKFVR